MSNNSDFPPTLKPRKPDKIYETGFQGETKNEPYICFNFLPGGTSEPPTLGSGAQIILNL
jgi:hypothetical protein